MKVLDISASLIELTSIGFWETTSTLSCSAYCANVRDIVSEVRGLAMNRPGCPINCLSRRFVAFSLSVGLTLNSISFSLPFLLPNDG